MRGITDLNPDFRCASCGARVSGRSPLAGVNHRNHCPYCLWSRHLDLYAAGDRLSACKAPMAPIGLTFKRRQKKYAAGGGELMLVHRCRGCGALSLNRIAADDLGEVVLGVFAASTGMPAAERWSLHAGGIELLREADRPAVCRQLFGKLTLEG